MPSGGIEPFNRSKDDPKTVMTIKDKLDPGHGGCWVCHRGGAFHMLHEWDSWIHARCAVTYLHYGLHPRPCPDPRFDKLLGEEASEPPIHPMDEEAQIVIENGYIVILDFSLEQARA